MTDRPTRPGVHLRRPSAAGIAALLVSDGLAFSYPELGASADLDSADARAALAPRYDIDRREYDLGRGRALFERARAALLAWRQFEIPWLELYGVGPVVPGRTVATLLPLSRLWFLSPCRVVYAELDPGGDAVAYAYGTLQGHPESGEERFALSFDPATEAVHYRVAAFSRPARLFSKLGYPFARRLQARFAVASARALERASR